MSQAKVARPQGARVPSTGEDDWPLRLCVLLFAGSGCSALIYEIIWFQLLELVVGSSAISLGILLAIFMGGLCLGGLLFPRVVAARHHPFFVYAILELGIGALAIFVLYAVPAMGMWYRGTALPGLLGIIVRAAIAGICLLPPTVLMGAALPAVARWVEATPRGVAWLGALYASNITGGVIGCLLAGFTVLRLYGTATATYVAVTLNVIVGGVGLLVASQKEWRAREGSPAQGARKLGEAGLIVVAVSGFCALGAQVVWTRLLSLLLGATVYTFSIILAVFLVGLGVGSAIGSLVARSSRHPLRDLGVCQMLLTAAIAWTAFLISASLPYWPIAPSLSPGPWISFQLDAVRAIWAVVPGTVLWGASFPLAVAAARPGETDSGKLIAGVYVANTIGAMVGALSATFILIPLVGTHTAQQILIALSAAAGLYGLGRWSWSSRDTSRVARTAAVPLAVVLVIPLLRLVPPVNGPLIAYGRSLAIVRGTVNPPRFVPNLLFAGEGLSQSVAVTEDAGHRVFHVSGKVEASTALKDMRLQRMLGLIPALIHPSPRSALIVGFGAGVTAGTFVLPPTIQRIVICEIEPLVPRRVSEYFRDANGSVYTDPRVEIVYDDARHYMLTAKEKFDIITSDPIHPWVKGSAALYSKEYFELVRSRLNPGGVVSQWVPLYQTSKPTVQSELATFFTVFPNGTVWGNTYRGQGYDLVLVGTDGPTRIDLSGLNNRLMRPDHWPVVRALRQIVFGSPADLLSTYTGQREDLEPWLAGAQINEDRRLWLQYQAGLDTYVAQEEGIYADMLRFRRFPERAFVGPEGLKEPLRAAMSAPPSGQ